MTILLGRDDEALRARVHQLAPDLETVSPAQLEAEPSLWQRVEVAYGGFNKNDLERAPALKWIQNGGAGVNNLLTPDLRERDIWLTNVSGIHARAITEHTFGMLLFLTRQLREAHENQASHQWTRFGSNVLSLYGKTLGVLGVGAIGAQMARVGRAFDMRVIGLRRGGAPHPDIEAMFSPESKREFFAQSQIVFNVLPLTQSTRDFMGQAEFDALPDGSIVANAGRGATMNTDALLRALRSGKVRYALLDVTEPEPLPPAHPLWDEPGVFITPHFSGAHPEYHAEADAIFLDNLRLFLAGEPLHHLVDKDAGY